MITCIRSVEPIFPVDPGRTRQQIGPWWVEWSGDTPPTLAEVQAEWSPSVKDRGDKARELVAKKLADLDDGDPLWLDVRQLFARVAALETKGGK